MIRALGWCAPLATILVSVACGGATEVGANKPTPDAGPEAPAVDNPATATVTGTIAGRPIVVKSVVGAVVNGQPTIELWVDIVNREGVCTLSRQGAKSFANLTGLRLGVSYDQQGWANRTNAIGSKVYVIGDELERLHVYARSFVNDSSCASVAGSAATSGTFTVALVTSSFIQGSFDLTFPDGPLKGDFIAPLCAAPPSSVSPPSCAP